MFYMIYYVHCFCRVYKDNKAKEINASFNATGNMRLEETSFKTGCISGGCLPADSCKHW